jgi:hypothetical protein
MLNIVDCDYWDHPIHMLEETPYRSLCGVSPIPVVVVLCASSFLTKILTLVLPRPDVVASLWKLIGKALAEVFVRVVVAGPRQVVMAQVGL